MSRSLTSFRQPVLCFILLFLLDTMAAEEMERDGDLRIQGKNFRGFFYIWLDPVSSFHRKWNLNFAELIPIYVPKFLCKIANLITYSHTHDSPGSPFTQNRQESPAPALGKPKYGKVGWHTASYWGGKMLCVFSACPPGYLKYHRESTVEVPMCLKSLCRSSAGCPLEEARRAIMQEQSVSCYRFGMTKKRWTFFTGSMKMRIVLGITYILNWGNFSTFFPPRRSWCLVAASTHSSAEEEEEEEKKLEEKELEEERHRSRSKLLARRRKAGIVCTRGRDFFYSLKLFLSMVVKLWL